MTPRTRLPRATDRIRLAGTGLDVSPLCLGVSGSPKTVHAAFEAGINFFFVTADMHWPYYAALRKGLQSLLASRRGIRDEIVVAAVCYPTQPDFNSMPFHELVESVPGLDRIDVAVMGGVYASDFMARYPVYAGHRRTAFEGTRAIGATFHEREIVPAAANHRLVDIAFSRYNPAHAGARESVFPHLKRRGRAPLFNFKSTYGFVGPKRRAELGLPKRLWQPQVTDYYRFALSAPEMDGLLCSPWTPHQVQELVDALEHGPLTSDEQAFLMNLARLDAGELELEPDAS